jgi:hypothetical protein
MRLPRTSGKSRRAILTLNYRIGIKRMADYLWHSMCGAGRRALNHARRFDTHVKYSAPWLGQCEITEGSCGRK